MTVVVVSPPAQPLISLAEAKAQLRLDGADDDQLVEGYIAAATAWIDGPDGWLGRALISQTLELRAGGFPVCGDGEIDLPYPPVASVTSVTYSDSDGADQVLAADKYRLAGRFLSPAFGTSWPSTRAQRDALRIQYVAGYGVEPDKVPAPIRQAILLLIGHWYGTRETVNIGNITSELPFTTSALLAPYRVWRV